MKPRAADELSVSSQSGDPTVRAAETVKGCFLMFGGVEELRSVGFFLRGGIAPSRGRSSSARLGSSLSVLGPHFAAERGSPKFYDCFQVLVRLLSSFHDF